MIRTLQVPGKLIHRMLPHTMISAQHFPQLWALHWYEQQISEPYDLQSTIPQTDA
jgi:hypothetical protein